MGRLPDTVPTGMYNAERPERGINEPTGDVVCNSCLQYTQEWLENINPRYYKHAMKVLIVSPRLVSAQLVEYKQYLYDIILPCCVMGWTHLRDLVAKAPASCHCHIQLIFTSSIQKVLMITYDLSIIKHYPAVSRRF
jgi:hypothetical protein